jgi:hypothetical protein
MMSVLGPTGSFVRLHFFRAGGERGDADPQAFHHYHADLFRGAADYTRALGREAGARAATAAAAAAAVAATVAPPIPDPLSPADEPLAPPSPAPAEPPLLPPAPRREAERASESRPLEDSAPSAPPPAPPPGPDPRDAVIRALEDRLAAEVEGLGPAERAAEAELAQLARAGADLAGRVRGAERARDAAAAGAGAWAAQAGRAGVEAGARAGELEGLRRVVEATQARLLHENIGCHSKICKFFNKITK